MVESYTPDKYNESILPSHLKSETAKTRIEKAVEHRTQKFNETHNTVTFHVGENVLLKANPIGKSIYNKAIKCFRIYDGPYILQEKVGRNTFIVVDESKNKILGKYHAAFLRKYFTEV